MIVDSTVQRKAKPHSVDSRLLETARYKVASAARRAGIGLKQTYAQEAKSLRRKAGGYAEAKQLKRLHKTLERRITILRSNCLNNARPVKKSGQLKTVLGWLIQEHLAWSVKK